MIVIFVANVFVHLATIIATVSSGFIRYSLIMWLWTAIMVVFYIPVLGIPFTRLIRIMEDLTRETSALSAKRKLCLEPKIKRFKRLKKIYMIGFTAFAAGMSFEIWLHVVVQQKYVNAFEGAAQ